MLIFELLFIYKIGQYYTDDQLANMYCFSMLYQWLHHSFTTLQNTDLSSLEAGLQTDLESSGGFQISSPRSIGTRSSKSSRSTTPTKQPVSRSVTTGMLPSPKSNSEVSSKVIAIFFAYYFKCYLMSLTGERY